MGPDLGGGRLTGSILTGSRAGMVYDALKTLGRPSTASEVLDALGDRWETGPNAVGSTLRRLYDEGRVIRSVDSKGTRRWEVR